MMAGRAPGRPKPAPVPVPAAPTVVLPAGTGHGAYQGMAGVRRRFSVVSRGQAALARGGSA